jgi:hypothetical protein
MNKITGFHCATCGKWHDEFPFDLGADVPDMAYDIPPSEYESRVVGNCDFFVIDNQYYFARGIIEIPILGDDLTFNWGVWVSRSEKNFRRMTELLQLAEREKECAYFGWLCTALPYPEPTLNLKTMVHTQSVGLRPKIEREPTSHPLAIEQKQGIIVKRDQQIVEELETAKRTSQWIFRNSHLIRVLSHLTMLRASHRFITRLASRRKRPLAVLLGHHVRSW